MRRFFLTILVMACVSVSCTKVPAHGVHTKAIPETQNVGETITLILGYTGPNDKVLDMLIQAFEEASPEYRIVKQMMPVQSVEQMSLIKSGKLDLVVLSSVFNTDEASQSLMALDPFLAKSRLDQRAYGEIGSELQLSGYSYGLPFVRNPLVIVADKSRFQKAGLSQPPGCWTWDEFRVAALKMTDHSTQPTVWGYQFTAAYLLPVIWMTDQSGLPYWRAPRESVRPPLQFFMTMAETDHSLNPTAIGAKNQSVGLEAIRQGKAAMTEETWRPDLAQQAIVLPTPCLNPAKPLMSSNNEHLAIPEASKHPNEAWRFLEYASGPEGAELLARFGQLPAYMSEDVQTAWFSQLPAPPPVTEIFFKTRWITNPSGLEAPFARGRVLKLFTWTLEDGRTVQDAYASYLEMP